MSGETASRLLVGLYGRLPRGAFVVIFRVFMDETSSHDDPNEPLMLTGCVSTPLRWSRLEKRWQQILRDNGGARYVRWYELQHGTGQFTNTTVEQRIKVVEELDACVFANIRFGFCTVLEREAFRTYKDAKGTSLSSMLDSDYGVSFRVAMGFLQSVLPMIVGESYPSLYVLVEDGHENSGSVSEIFKQYRKDILGKERIIKGVTLVGKEDYPGTQVADMRGAGFLMQEVRGGQHFQDLPVNLKDISNYANQHKLPWYRLPINEGVLMDIRDALILSKQSFAARFGNLLSPNFWNSSFPPKKQPS
jgi:hypothetical protein